MNPDAFLHWRIINSPGNEQEMWEHKIPGHLRTAANKQGRGGGLYGIPYFERSKILTTRFSSFLVALMKCVCISVICAAVLAYLFLIQLPGR